MTDKQVWEKIATLTLEEKASLCSGATAWLTQAIDKKDIPELLMADGPHGLRLENRENEKATGSHSYPATCFPTAVALACSFSPQLAGQVGAAIAAECRHYGVHMILGPGVNIKRSPLNGRNFEYFSEDPLLAGEMAAAYINGVQNAGVGASLKHFAVNNQEYKRMSISAEVDDRALFDLYLKPFEIAVRKAQPATVMCSYNRVNGEYASENSRLLTSILRLRFGFAGAVVSDWGAVNSRPAGILAGLDLEMPSSGGANDAEIVQSVQTGALPENALDTACFNLLRLVFTYVKPDAPQRPTCDFAQNHQLAVQAATQSAVLLKNEGLLPLKQTDSLAVIGQMAETPRYQGGGSSIVNPQNLVGFTAALRAEQIPFTFSQGYEQGDTSPTLLQHAVQTAKTARNVVLFLGLPDAYECEGYDRQHLALPEGHVELLHAVAASNPNLCVVLNCGSPVQTPWLAQVKALLCMHLGGQGAGPAILQLLYGRANPSGKLAESWPLTLEDIPCYQHYPMGPTYVTYNESLFVGYRYYNTVGKDVQFPFGYGLSYTTYTYESLRINPPAEAGQPLTAHFVVANTGNMSGDEIVQLYIGRSSSAAWQPAHELKAFARVTLAPGESKEVTLQVPYEDFGFYYPPAQRNIVEQGEYTIQVGPHSRLLPLTSTCQVPGISIQPPPELSRKGYYGNLQSNNFPFEEFTKLYPAANNNNAPVQKGSYTTTTTLGEMGQSFWGRRVLSLAIFVSRRFIRFSTDKEANHRAALCMAQDLPLRGIVTQTVGLVSPAAIQTLVRMCNGKGGFWRLVGQIVKRPAYHKKKKNINKP